MILELETGSSGLHPVENSLLEGPMDLSLGAPKLLKLTTLFNIRCILYGQSLLTCTTVVTLFNKDLNNQEPHIVF